MNIIDISFNTTMRKTSFTILVSLILLSITNKSNCQGLITKEQGEYFYGFINTLPDKCNVTSSFAEEIRNNHQKAFVSFKIDNETRILCESVVLYRENYKADTKLPALVLDSDHKSGFIQSCLFYANRNLAYIVTYAKGVYDEKAIAIIWSMKDGSVESMHQGIVNMNRFSNNDNNIWHRLILDNNNIIIKEYSEINSFTLISYNGTFLIIK